MPRQTGEATKQRIVYGAKVEQSENGAPDSFVDVEDAKGIAVPTTETDYQDATSLSSADGFREWVPGLKDAGVLGVPCGYTSAEYMKQHRYSANKKLMYYRTTMPPEDGQATGDVFEFRGYPTPQLAQDDVGAIIGMTVSIRTSGGVKATEGTPVEEEAAAE